MSRWEVFPRRRWPREFGLRIDYRPPRHVADLDQLELAWELVAPPATSHQERARANLREIFTRTGWSQHAFAGAVLGCHERTLQRYLAGGRIPEDRAVWLNRLEAATLHGDRVLIIVRSAAPIARLVRWRRDRQKATRGAYQPT